MIILHYTSQILSFNEKEYIDISISIELVIQVWYFISNDNELSNSYRVSFNVNVSKVFIRQYTRWSESLYKWYKLIYISFGREKESYN